VKKEKEVNNKKIKIGIRTKKINKDKIKRQPVRDCLLINCLDRSSS